jgi:hypothetical protein
MRSQAFTPSNTAEPSIIVGSVRAITTSIVIRGVEAPGHVMDEFGRLGHRMFEVIRGSVDRPRNGADLLRAGLLLLLRNTAGLHGSGFKHLCCLLAGFLSLSETQTRTY